MQYDIIGTYIANSTGTIKAHHSEEYSPKNFLLRYFANAQYDAVLKIFGGICFVYQLLFKIL